MKKTVIVSPKDEIIDQHNCLRTVNAKYYDSNKQVLEREIYFRISGNGVGRPLKNSDYAVISVLFGAMRWGRDIKISGTVSRVLLSNLEEFQKVFRSWMPETYNEVTVEPEKLDASIATDEDIGIAAFSGGVDACFTAFRHYYKSPGKFHIPLSALMMVHGFDIPLDNESGFEASLSGAKKIIDGMDLDILTVKTNLRGALPQWEQNFGAGLAACFNAIGGRYNVGLIGSDEPYSHLALPWGSNPISNPFLSSRNVRIFTDGSGYTRTEKVHAISRWQGPLNGVRVCWEGPPNGKNCGGCEKCKRTILNFRAAGISNPPAFHTKLSDDGIRGIHLRNKVQVEYLREIWDYSQSSGATGSWLEALKSVLKKYDAI